MGKINEAKGGGWSERSRRAAVAADLDPLARGARHAFEVGNALWDRDGRRDGDGLSRDRNWARVGRLRRSLGSDSGVAPPNKRVPTRTGSDDNFPNKNEPKGRAKIRLKKNCLTARESERVEFRSQSYKIIFVSHQNEQGILRFFCS